MKKIVVIVTILLLSLSIMVQAGATGSATMGLSASAGSVYRGDSVTVSVYLANSNLITNGGINLSYNSAVFEFVSGSRSVGDFGGTNSNGGVFSYDMGSEKAASGTIFTFTFRIKADAPFGTYTISGNGNLDALDGKVSCSVSGASVTVSCRHEYGAAVKTDDASHKRVCIHCGGEDVASHAWKDVSVDRNADCKTPGQKTVQCSDCGFTTTQELPVTSNHAYGGWNQVGASTHSRTCSVCGKQASDYHTWNDGTVNQAATCQQTGSKTVRCTGCGYTKDEVIPLAEHTYDPMKRVDADTHTHTCTVCAHVETLEHTFAEIWTGDADGHHLECTGCGEKKDRSAHIPGAAATQDTPQLCTVCAYTLMPELSHDHTYKTVWDSDEDAHWHACDSCIITKDWQEHSYESVCSGACSVCGKERVAPHEQQQVLTADESGHWYPCTQCDEKLSFTPHTPGPEATTSSAQTCTVCGFVITPVLPHEHIYDAAQDHWHACACGERYSADPAQCQICYVEPFPWWMVCVAEFAVLGAVIIVLLILLGKKKKQLREHSWQTPNT